MSLDQKQQIYASRMGSAKQRFTIGRRSLEGMDTNQLKKLRSLKYVGRLKQMGFPWGRTGIRRVYLEMGLKPCRKCKRRVSARIKVPLNIPKGMNSTWSMGFVHDVLDNSRKFRVLNIIDVTIGGHRGRSLSYHSLPALRVIDLLDRLILFKGKPQTIPYVWTVEPHLHPESLFGGVRISRLTFSISNIQPGKPTQNAFIERFKSTYREDILDAYIFRSHQ